MGGRSPADKEERLLALEREESVASLLGATARLLVDVLEATACTISRAIGDLLVELVDHSPSGPVQLGHGYLISDYPATREVLEQLRPRAIALADPEADEQEAALLRRLGFDSLLMLPLGVGGQAWGLVEIYANGRAAFTAREREDAEQAVARSAAVLARLTGAA